MVSVSSNSLAPDSTGRVTVFCQDVPYPANHGGKVDLWNLIRGLHRHAITIQLVCWFQHERIAPGAIMKLENVAADVVEVRRRDGWWRLLNARYPPRMLAFCPGAADRAELSQRVHAFAPDWLLFDHWAAYLTARTLAAELDRPLVYRSQNVEHRYYRELRRVAHGSLKLKLALNSLRLRATEAEIRSSVDLVADISADDLNEWSSLPDAAQTLVVPPVWIDHPLPRVPSETRRDIDILFVGNLRTPNNVEGLRWFCAEVLPTLRSRLAPEVPRVVFAGSDPDAADTAFWRDAGVQCDANPADVSIFYPRAQVVVNPVRRGSGVNLKMIEAFATGRPVVATSAAVRGLPEIIRSHAVVADSAQEFASAVHDALRADEKQVDPVERAQLVEGCFGPANLQSLISAVAALRSKRGVPVPTVA